MTGTKTGPPGCNSTDLRWGRFPSWHQTQDNHFMCSAVRHAWSTGQTTPDFGAFSAILRTSFSIVFI